MTKTSQKEGKVLNLRGKETLSLDTILWIRGDINYVTIFTERGSFVCAKTLKDIEGNIESHDFLRIHKSHIVNKKYVAKLHVHGTCGLVTLQNGERLKVSRRRLKDVADKM